MKITDRSVTSFPRLAASAWAESKPSSDRPPKASEPIRKTTGSEVDKLVARLESVNERIDELEKRIAELER